MHNAKLATILIIPRNVETLLQLTSGNMGLHGVYLEVYYKRNLLYISLLALLPCYLFGYMNYSVAFVLFALFIYFKSCWGWREIIFKQGKINV